MKIKSHWAENGKNAQCYHLKWFSHQFRLRHRQVYNEAKCLNVWRWTIWNAMAIPMYAVYLHLLIAIIIIIRNTMEYNERSAIHWITSPSLCLKSIDVKRKKKKKRPPKIKRHFNELKFICNEHKPIYVLFNLKFVFSCHFCRKTFDRNAHAISGLMSHFRMQSIVVYFILFKRIQYVWILNTQSLYELAKRLNTWLFEFQLIYLIACGHAWMSVRIQNQLFSIPPS